MTQHEKYSKMPINNKIKKQHIINFVPKTQKKIHKKKSEMSKPQRIPYIIHNIANQ